nr:polyprenyl synthetase family protein [Oscillatoria laete-virens]
MKVRVDSRRWGAYFFLSVKTLVKKTVARLHKKALQTAIQHQDKFVTRDSPELAAVFDCVREPVSRVEELVLAQVERFDPGVRSYISYALSTHGKRIRPAMVYFAGGACGHLTQEHDKLALILELIHLATLVHDDIIDEATVRRGQPTVQRKWGAETAVLVGDSIFAHALMEATTFDDREICRRISFESNEVCQGEILQTQRRFDYTMAIPEYFKLIEMKTGALFRASTELSAKLSLASDEQIAAMREFGTRLGIAYQIWDDCVDIYGHENEIGKSLGTDIDKGKLTLPILLFLGNATSAEQALVRELMLRHTAEAREQLARMIEQSGAFDESIKVIVDQLDKADSCLDIFESSLHKDSMTGFISYLRGRTLRLKK